MKEIVSVKVTLAGANFYQSHQLSTRRLRKDFCFVLSRAWDEEKILRYHEESGLGFRSLMLYHLGKHRAFHYVGVAYVGFD